MLSKLKLLLAALAVAVVPGVALALHPEIDLTVRWKAPDGTILKEITMDLAGLEALPQQSFRTTTPWTDGVQSFSGPSIGEIAALGPHPVKEATFVALNDYVGTLPPEDWTDLGAILATRHNGEPMDIRRMGPYWVVFPIDEQPSILDVQRYHARMVWQVKAVDFVVE
ncbi:hypothetical protein [Amorphus sp. MBR-141]